ncbi:MAG: hypothetical protein QXT26_02405 [Thermoproteota archaeon]
MSRYLHSRNRSLERPRSPWRRASLILKVLASADSPLSVYALYRRLKKEREGATANYSTVLGDIADLEGLKLVRLVDRGPRNAKLYELTDMGLVVLCRYGNLSPDEFVSVISHRKGLRSLSLVKKLIDEHIKRLKSSGRLESIEALLPVIGENVRLLLTSVAILDILRARGCSKERLSSVIAYEDEYTCIEAKSVEIEFMSQIIDLIHIEDLKSLSREELDYLKAIIHDVIHELRRSLDRYEKLLAHAQKLSVHLQTF